MNKIRAYVRMDEVNKVHFYKDFEVIDFVPEVGDPCFGEEIKEVAPVRLDVEQGREEVYDYDFFKIITTMNNEFDKANDVYCERWYAVKKPVFRVELHYWKEGSGYTHSETFDEVPDGYTAEQYVKEYDGNLVSDDESYDAINVELYDKDNKLVSEYWIDSKVCEIIKDGNYDVAVNAMDDELREQIHFEMAPCSEESFLSEYIKRHEEKFGEEFEI